MRKQTKPTRITPPQPKRATRDRARTPLFGTVIRQAIQDSGLTLGQISIQLEHMLGVPCSKSELSQLQSGNRSDVRAPTLQALGQILNLDPVWLFKLVLWNRKNSTAEEIPDTLPKTVGEGMLVRGLEENFVKRFRNLNAEQQRLVMDAVDLAEVRGGKVGVQPAEGATFRRRKRG